MANPAPEAHPAPAAHPAGNGAGPAPGASSGDSSTGGPDDARLAILAKVRNAQVRAYIPAARPGLPARMAYPPMDLPALRARLKQELELLGVETHVAATDAEARGKVKELIAGKSVLSWDPEHLPCGAAECLAGEKVWYGKDAREEQGRADIGLTGCEAALAETGSLAMVAGPGRPRTPSLLPYVHVVIIRGSDIVLGMGEFFERYKALPRLPYVVFITGPSRTADIELSLTLGVHGPGKVIAILAP
jgi:L-lactate dehydrogenase complex protein LldG